MNHEKLLFYDIEVFQQDSLVVFKDYAKTTKYMLWNDDPDRGEKIANIIKDKIIGGYNNHSYDDRILTLMLENASPEDIKKANDSIIYGADPNITIDIRIRSIDVMQQLLQRPSLKQIEGNLGMSIVESSVDFHQTEALTQEQKRETELYCCHDVEATIEAFKLREQSYFDVKDSLIDMLPENMRERAIRWNTTTISANLLKPKKDTATWSGIRGSDDIFRSLDTIPEDAWKMWEGLSLSNINDKGNFVTTEQYGCEITFGVGGLHGAPRDPAVYENVVDLDVSSMYPSIIVLPQIRALGDATGLYDSMRTERIRIKKSDPVKAAAYKLILNSVYGNFKNEYSTLNNPFASVSVTIYGQIAAMHLCDMLHKAGYQIFNINTDGIMIVDRPDPVRPYAEIKEEWQKRFGMMLEAEKFRKLIQRDVNNYIAIAEDGSIKVKGGDTKKYYDPDPFGNADARITHIALVDYLLKGVPIEETFDKWMDQPAAWMYVLKAGSTFKGVQDANGIMQQNVNRVFAAREGTPGITRLHKIKYDGQIIKFQSAPERMLIWNNDLSEIGDIRDFIDTGHYKAIVEDKIRQWTEPKKIPQKREKKAKKAEAAESKKGETKEESHIQKIIRQHIKNAKPSGKKNGHDSWKFSCPCPGHGAGRGDINESAGIYYEPGRHRYVAHCFGGCSEEEVLKEFGISIEDLGGRKKTDIDSTNWLNDAIEGLKKKHNTTKIKLVATYDYIDKDDTYVNTKIRYLIDNSTRKRMISGRRIGDIFVFDKGKLHPDPVLYNIKALVNSAQRGSTVYYVEGEKDVETLVKHGWIAVTAGGASDFKASMAREFIGRQVVILADNDKPGLDSANEVAKYISKYCSAYKILTPSSKDKGDVTDYLEGMNGKKPEGTIDGLKARIEETEWIYTFSKPELVKGEIKIVYSEGSLKDFVERSCDFFISERVGDSKKSLFVFDGKKYTERNINDLNGIIQSYIPNIYVQANKVSNVAALLRNSLHNQIRREDLEG